MIVLDARKQTKQIATAAIPTEMAEQGMPRAQYTSSITEHRKMPTAGAKHMACNRLLVNDAVTIVPGRYSAPITNRHAVKNDGHIVLSDLISSRDSLLDNHKDYLDGRLSD